MYKYKKLVLNIVTVLYIIIFLIELIKYFFIDSNLYGVFYLLINLLIIFFLVPTTYNYKKYYSTARISKLIIIMLLGIFNSYILELIVVNNMGYIDSSKEYIKSIFVYKDILKGILYFILFIFTLLEFKLDKVLIGHFEEKSKHRNNDKTKLKKNKDKSKGSIKSKLKDIKENNKSKEIKENSKS